MNHEHESSNTPFYTGRFFANRLGVQSRRAESQDSSGRSYYKIRGIRVL